MPWHREDVLDLLDGQRTSRKLKAAELDGRRAATEYIRPFVAAARELGLRIEFPSFKIRMEYNDFERKAVGSFDAHTVTSWMLVEVLTKDGLLSDETRDWLTSLRE